MTRYCCYKLIVKFPAIKIEISQGVLFRWPVGDFHELISYGEIEVRVSPALIMRFLQFIL